MLIQSLVVAVLFGAFLFADRGYRSTQLGRRIFQIALAVAIVLAIIAISEAVIRLPEDTNFDDLNQTSRSLDYGKVLRTSSTLRSAAGLVLILGSLGKLSRLPTVSQAGLLAGVLVLLNANSLGSNGSYVDLLTLTSNEVNETQDALNALVLSAGAVILTLYGLNHWDRQAREDVAGAGRSHVAAIRSTRTSKTRTYRRRTGGEEE